MLKNKYLFVFIKKIALLSGEGDDYPEASFYMTGNLEETFEKGRKIASDTTKHCKKI